MQQGVDTQMRAFGGIGCVLVPELGRLITKFPGAAQGAGAEYAFLGAGGFLVAADADNDALIGVPIQKFCQAGAFACG